jgi:uncharacterized protein with FMN-binding domain
VSKAGRKGRISNELVAASCAAILTVYAAGSWRTRDAAARFGSEGQMRPPVRPAPVSMVSAPAAVAAMIKPAPAVPPAAVEPQPAAKKLSKAVPAPPLPAALPQSSSVATPTDALVAVDEKVEPDPEGKPEAAVAAAEADTPAPSHKPWFDGYYTGWGTSRHGDIQAFVTIKDGRIINAGVATCETRYPCSVINHILLQPIDLQGPDVDRVSRATESGDAYYYGLVQALGNAETGTFRSTRP